MRKGGRRTNQTKTQPTKQENKNEINKANKITNTIQEMTIEKRRNYFCEV